MTQKRIKVQYRSRGTSSGYTDVPMIQMTGLWLEGLGFSIGDTIMLEYDKDGIRIRPLTESEKDAAAKDELELALRRKKKELSFLQEQINSDSRRLAMVAESDNSYNDHPHWEVTS